MILQVRLEKKFKILDKQSFENTLHWLDDVKKEHSGDGVVLMLVGNKTDLSDLRQVTVEEGESRAKENNCLFIETSAKAGHNIKALFTRGASALPKEQKVETETFVIPLVNNNTSTEQLPPGGCWC